MSVARVLAVVAALAVSGGVTRARAEGRQSCLDAHPQAQKLRRAQRLRDARERLAICAAAACPAPIRRDCAVWLEEVDREIPTVVIDARDAAGAPVRGGELVIDGAPSVLDGEPVALDPGAHTIRLRVGAVEATAAVTLDPGEKRRVVALALLAPPRPTPLRPEARATVAPSRGPAYALLAAGAAGLGTFAVLGLTGKREEARLRDSCGRFCDEGDVRALRVRYLLADAAGAVGLVALAAGSYLWWRAGHASSEVAVAAGSAHWRLSF